MASGSMFCFAAFITYRTMDLLLYQRLTDNLMERIYKNKFTIIIICKLKGYRDLLIKRKKPPLNEEIIRGGQNKMLFFKF